MTKDMLHIYIHVCVCVLRKEDGHIFRRVLDFEVNGQRKERRSKEGKEVKGRIGRKGGQRRERRSNERKEGKEAKGREGGQMKERMSKEGTEVKGKKGGQRGH